MINRDLEITSNVIRAILTQTKTQTKKKVHSHVDITFSLVSLLQHKKMEWI